MEKDLQELAHEDEEKLVKELASMRVELTPESDFEARFLADFHERLAATETATQTRLPFFVRVKAAISSPFGRAWVMGACAVVVVGFLVGGLVTVPEEEDVSVVSVMSIPTSNMVGKARMIECVPAPEPCCVAEPACVDVCAAEPACVDVCVAEPACVDVCVAEPACVDVCAAEPPTCSDASVVSAVASEAGAAALVDDEKPAAVAEQGGE